MKKFHEVIEAVVDKRHLRMMECGMKESMAAKNCAKYLVSLKWKYRRNKFLKNWINSLIEAYRKELPN